MDIAGKVGTATMYDYFDKFGLNKKTGIDIKGETSGLFIKESSVKNVDIARIGFGQAVAVTPIGLISAVSSVINGGYKITPRVLKSVEDANGKSISTASGSSGERIISEKTSATMREYLEGVVSHGGGSHAYVPGYRRERLKNTRTEKSQAENIYLRFWALRPLKIPNTRCS